MGEWRGWRGYWGGVWKGGGVFVGSWGGGMRKLVLLLALTLPGMLLRADDLTRLQIHVTNERGKPVDRASVIVKFINGRSAKALGLKKARLSWELKSSQGAWPRSPGFPRAKI